MPIALFFILKIPLIFNGLCDSILRVCSISVENAVVIWRGTALTL